MALKLFQEQEKVNLTVEQAEEFLRVFSIDIYELGLPYLQREEEDIFHDSRYHFKRFEGLKAEPVIDEQERQIIRITGTYVTKPKDKYPTPEDYNPIRLDVPLEGRLE